MRHEELKKMLILSLYGELNEGERFLLDEHLEKCAGCRQEVADLESFHRYLGSDASEIPQELLFQARHSLWQSLDQEYPRTTRHGLARLLGGRRSPAGVQGHVRLLWWLAPALRGAFLLAAGLLAGYGIFHSGAGDGTELRTLDSASIANIRFLDSDPADQQIDLVYDEVRPVRLKGSIDDQAVRQVLAHAAVHERNAGIRLRAVSELDEHLDALPGDLIKQTLIVSLQTDENAGVRRRALEALQRLPFDADVQRAYLYVLQYDPNPGMRVSVINALEMAALEGQSMAPGILDVLKERTVSDENDYVRIRSKSFLKQVEFK